MIDSSSNKRLRCLTAVACLLLTTTAAAEPPRTDVRASRSFYLSFTPEDVRETPEISPAGLVDGAGREREGMKHWDGWLRHPMNVAR
ncbi:MAG: hypothetical protein ACT4QC_18325 [Planctomycetaceae bacterium]